MLDAQLSLLKAYRFLAPLRVKLLLAAMLYAFEDMAHAVMIRHDVQDSSYQALAQQPEFQSAQVLFSALGTSGTLISSRFVLTAGHPVAGWVTGTNTEAPANIPINIKGVNYTGNYVHLFPSYDRVQVSGGFDVAIVRLSTTVTNLQPTAIWVGGASVGQRLTGVGQGKTGTGWDNNEPLAAGTFRGYQNAIDFVYGTNKFSHWRSDFDNGDPAYNTLGSIVYESPNMNIAGTSSPTPFPLEGSTAAGDSGSGIFFPKRSGWFLAGVASYRWYSMYGGQPGYVNLSFPAITAWIKSVAQKESAPFQLVTNVPAILTLINSGGMLRLDGNLDRQYRIEFADSLSVTNNWQTFTNIQVSSFPMFFSLSQPASNQRFFRAVELP